MNLLRITLALALCTFSGTLAYATDAVSGVTLLPGHRAAFSRGHGDWVRSRAHTTPGMVNGNTLAVDPNSISFSNSSAFRGAGGEVFGNSLNITVGPGTGSASTGFARGAGFFPGVQIQGSTTPFQAGVRSRATGLQTQTIGRAVRFPYGP